MEGMFYFASDFNQDISGWAVDSVRNMYKMFYHASAFDQDLGWCVGDNVDLTNAFYNTPCRSTSCGVKQVAGGCAPTSAPTTTTPAPTPRPTLSPRPTPLPTSEPTALPSTTPTSEPTTPPTPEPTALPSTTPTPRPTLHHPTPRPTPHPTPLPTPGPTPQPTINNVMTDSNIGIAVGAWLSNPTFAEAIYGHISRWETGGVTDMSRLFNGASSFNEDIGAWDTSGVTSMNSMFNDALSFDQDIGGWRVDKVTDMYRMFDDASSFEQDLGWCVDDNVNLEYAFEDTRCESTSCGVIQGTCPPPPAPTSAPTPEPDDDDDDDSDCTTCSLIVYFSILFACLACLVFCACGIRRFKARQSAKTTPISPAATTPAPSMRPANIVRMGTVEAVHAAEASATDQVQATLVPHATVISVQEP